jgi:hypothetical protein
MDTVKTNFLFLFRLFNTKHQTLSQDCIAHILTVLKIWLVGSAEGVTRGRLRVVQYAAAHPAVVAEVDGAIDGAERDEQLLALFFVHHGALVEHHAARVDALLALEAAAAVEELLVTAGNGRAGQAANHIAAVQVPGKVIF